IELKFPRSGQYPEQMFKACQDLAFLEELVSAGFDGGLFLMAADDRLFYEGSDRGGLYSCFRAGRPICGPISKPTGDRNACVTIRGKYTLIWREANAMRYSYIAVNRSEMSTDG
ncbi:MAG: hypothetical protein ACRD2Q_11000, partial [Terriglobales bacterium]